MNFLKKIGKYKNFNKYLIYASLSSIASFIKYFLFAKILGELDFSYFSSVELYAAYGLYFGTIGLFDGVALFLPKLVKDKKEKLCKSISINSTSAILYISTFLVTIVSGIFYFFTDIPRTIILFAGVYLIVFNLFSHCLNLVNSYGNSTLMAKLNFIKNIFSLTFSLSAGYLYGINALLVSEIFGFTLIFSFVMYLNKYNMKLDLISDFDILKKIIEIGFPQLLNNILNNTFRNAERLIIITFIGLLAFGNYSFASLIITVGIAIQGILSQYLLPRIASSVGDPNSLKSYKKNIDLFIIIVTTIILIMYPIFSIIVDYVERTLFTEFSTGFKIMKILYFGLIGQFLLLHQPFFFVLRKHLFLNTLTVLSLIISLIIAFLIITFDYSIEFFALAFVINRFIFGSIVRIKLSTLF